MVVSVGRPRSTMGPKGGRLLHAQSGSLSWETFCIHPLQVVSDGRLSRKFHVPSESAGISLRIPFIAC